MRSNIINFWKKPTKRNIVKNHHREGSKEIERVQKQIIIEERGGWLKRRDTRREEEGNENSAYDEKRRRSAWSRKRERGGDSEKFKALHTSEKQKRASWIFVPVKFNPAGPSIDSDVRLFCAYNHRGGPSAMLKSDGKLSFSCIVAGNLNSFIDKYFTG